MFKRKQDGFTIVELLIVIVVIAVLAAITVVAYNGMQQRTRVATAQSHLRSLGQRIEINNIDQGAYLTTNTAYKQLLLDTKLWSSTRQMMYDPSASVNNQTFGLCSDTTRAVIFEARLTGQINDSTIGRIVYYYDSTSRGLRTISYDPVGTVGVSTREKVCNQIGAPSTYREWAHDLV